MGNCNKNIQRLDESEYKIIKDNPQLIFEQSQLVKYNKNYYILCQLTFQHKDEYENMILLCNKYKYQTTSILVNLSDYFAYDQGYGQIYQLDLIFNSPKLSLSQLNQLYEFNKIYYDESEIWYIIKQSLSYYQFYQNQTKIQNYGYADAYKMYITHDGLCLYPNFIFIQQTETTQYLDTLFLQSLGIDINNILENQLFMLTLAVIIFDLAILKSNQQSFIGLFDIKQYFINRQFQQGIKFVKKSYSKQLSGFLLSICQKNSEYDVKSYLQYIQNNKYIEIANHLDSDKYKHLLNQQSKSSFFQDQEVKKSKKPIFDKIKKIKPTISQSVNDIQNINPNRLRSTKST